MIKKTPPVGLHRLQTLILDVDGVFTDGRAWLGADGTHKRKFSVRDSMALRALRKEGVSVAIVTRETADEIRAQFEFTGVDYFIEGCMNKSAAVAEICEKLGVTTANCGYVTADEHDLGLSTTFGFSFSTLSASDMLQARVSFASTRAGGDGAVMEICALVRAAIQEHRDMPEGIVDRRATKRVVSN